jgi:hypothetical protein
MKFVFLAEPAARDLFPSSRVWNDPSILFRSLPEMAGLEAQLTSSRITSAQPSFVDGFLLGVVLLDGKDAPSASVVEKLSGFVHERFAKDAFFFLNDRATADDLMAWMIARHRLAAEVFAQFSARTDLAMAELRKTLLETESALSAADNALSQAGYPNLYLADEIAAADFSRPLSVLGASPHFSVSQITWRDLKSFRRLDLQLGRASIAGLVAVDVEGAYSGRRIANWKCQAARLTSGWNTFDRGAEFMSLDEPVKITVSWTGGSDAPTVGFGEPVADRTSTAFLANGSKLDRPLSFRVWRNVFSGTIKDPDNVDSDAPEADEQGILPDSELLSLIAYCDGPPHAKPEDHVTWKNDVSAAMVHPAGRQPMIGVLRAVAAERLRRISASVRLDHPGASPTEFAVVALPPDTDLRSGLVARLSRRFGQTPKSKLISSLMSEARWLPLEAGGRGEIAYEFDEPHTGPLDIFLMTRNSTDENAYAWALFSGLSLDVDNGDAQPK